MSCTQTPGEDHIFSVCLQTGTTFTYECTVEDRVGIGSTIWSGDLFKCSESSHRISLTHSQLYNSGVSAVCGNFSASSVGVDGSEYTSRLTFLGDLSDLNGTTVNCTLSSVLLVAKITVKVEG